MMTREHNRRQPELKWCCQAALVLLFLCGVFLLAGKDASRAAIALHAQAPAQQYQVPRIEVEEIDPAAGGPLTWFDDYEAAKEIARLTKKPLFVVIRCER